MKEKPRKKLGRPADPANADRTFVWQVRLNRAEHAEWLAMGKGHAAGCADIVRGMIAESLKRKRRKG